MYRPIGLDWFDAGYFKIAEPYNNSQDTINQYLDTSSTTWDAYKALSGGSWKEGDIYRVPDGENDFIHKAVTFETFKKMQFDAIVSSHPLHSNWADLTSFQPGSVYITQIGNEGQSSDSQNILCSTADFQPKEGQNFIRYHQEFDLSDYTYVPPKQTKRITSLVVGLPESGIFDAYKNSLYSYDFRAYAAGREEGVLGNAKEISQAMKDSMFGWHIKPADGFGHVIHKWFACGRPIITKGNYYQGKMAGALIEDGVTAIDLDKHSFDENIQLIKYWSEPENHKKMCQAAYEKFQEVVNFEKEAQQIKEVINSWLENTK